MASIWTLFAFIEMSPFFLTLVIKVDGDLQVSPDVGTSPDASDTGFEELMDVSDGKRDFTFGLVLGNH